MRRRNRDNKKILNQLTKPTSDRDDSPPSGLTGIRRRVYAAQIQKAHSLVESDDIDGGKKIVERILSGTLHDGVPDLTVTLSSAVSAAEANDIPEMQQHLAEAVAWLLRPRTQAKVAETNAPTGT